MRWPVLGQPLPRWRVPILGPRRSTPPLAAGAAEPRGRSHPGGLQLRALLRRSPLVDISNAASGRHLPPLNLHRVPAPQLPPPDPRARAHHRPSRLPETGAPGHKTHSLPKLQRNTTYQQPQDPSQADPRGPTNDPHSSAVPGHCPASPQPPYQRPLPLLLAPRDPLTSTT
jgi:hypothetical protein